MKTNFRSSPRLPAGQISRRGDCLGLACNSPPGPLLAQSRFLCWPRCLEQPRPPGHERRASGADAVRCRFPGKPFAVLPMMVLLRPWKYSGKAPSSAARGVTSACPQRGLGAAAPAGDFGARRCYGRSLQRRGIRSRPDPRRAEQQQPAAATGWNFVPARNARASVGLQLARRARGAHQRSTSSSLAPPPAAPMAASESLTLVRTKKRSVSYGYLTVSYRPRRRGSCQVDAPVSPEVVARRPPAGG